MRMWTVAACSKGIIAVGAKDSVLVFGITLFLYHFVEIAPYLLSVFFATATDVVDLQEFMSGLSATSTATTICIDELLS